MPTRDELIKKAEADQEAFIKEYNKLKEEEEEAKKQDDLEVKKAILSNKDDKFASEED